MATVAAASDRRGGSVGPTGRLQRRGRPEAVVACRKLEPRHAKGCALDTELRGGERSGERFCGTLRRLRDKGICGSSRTATRTIMVSGRPGLVLRSVSRQIPQVLVRRSSGAAGYA